MGTAGVGKEGMDYKSEIKGNVTTPRLGKKLGLLL
jgi:hypothetical protein